MEIYPTKQASSPLMQDLIIDRDRNKTILVIITYTIISLLLFAGLVIPLTSFSYNHLSFFSIITFAVFIVIIILAELTFWWAIWGMICHILARDPALVINHQRIQIGKLPMLNGNTLLLWEEVEVITVRYQFTQKYLVICPKNPRQYLSRFPLWTQLIMRIRSVRSGSISIPQFYLKVPVEEIFSRLFQQYAEELKQYGVHIRF